MTDPLRRTQLPEISTMLSRKPCRPRRTCCVGAAPGDLLLVASIQQRGEDLPGSGPRRLEREMPAVGGPRCALVVAPGCQLAGARPVHRHDVDLVGPALPGSVGNAVAPRSPTWL